MTAVKFNASKEALVRDCPADLVLRLPPAEYDLAFAWFNRGVSSVVDEAETYDGWVYDVKVFEFKGYRLKVYRRMGVKDVFVVHGDGSKIMVVKE